MEARAETLPNGMFPARAILAAEDCPRVTLSPEALVEGHLDMVHGYALALCRQKDLAEDAVQRAFLKAFQKLHTLQDPRAVRSWLITILRNELAMEWRGRSRLVALEEPEWAELPGEDAEEPEIDPGLLAELPKALERLSEGAREILLLRYQQELSYEEISALLGVPLGTVQSRIHRAKLALRTHLSPVSGGRP
jgi:RNA polymerase sigma-70 factor (ECF subfamily)